MTRGRYWRLFRCLSLLCWNTFHTGTTKYLNHPPHCMPKTCNITLSDPNALNTNTIDKICCAIWSERKYVLQEGKKERKAYLHTHMHSAVPLLPRPLIAFLLHSQKKSGLRLCIGAKNRYLWSNRKRGGVGSFSATLKSNPKQRQLVRKVRRK